MIEVFRRAPSFMSFFGVVMVIPILGFAAGISSITLSPDPPRLGYSCTYTIHVNAGDMPLSYSMQYQCLEGGGSDWTPNPATTASGSSFGYVESYVGSQNVKGGEQYLATPYPPTSAWTYLTKGVTVSGPDTETITSGLNTNSTVYSYDPDTDYTVSYVDLDFSIYCNGGEYLVGTGASCRVEERIRRPQTSFDSGWTASSAEYSWQGPYGYIYDHKTITADSSFNAIATGTVIDDLYQQNRMIVKNCMNEDVIFYFPEHHFQKKKTATGWQVIEL